MIKLPETKTHTLNQAADPPAKPQGEAAASHHPPCPTQHLCHRENASYQRNDGCCELKLDAVTSRDANMYSFLSAHFSSSRVEAGASFIRLHHRL